MVRLPVPAVSIRDHKNRQSQIPQTVAKVVSNRTVLEAETEQDGGLAMQDCS